MLKLYVMASEMRHRLACLHGDRRGVTSMEYGIIAATTVVVVGGVVGGLNGSLTAIWGAIDTALSGAAPAPAP
jgi:Flp pilus assembly pilin Flp